MILRKILVVDDDPLDREMLREILKAEPTWGLTEIDDGQAALDSLCDGNIPDVCLIDVHMPRVGGLELAQRMRRDPTLKGLRIVVASGSRDKETIVAFAKLQIAGYLLKPYAADKTLTLLRSLLATTEADPLKISKNLLSRTALVVEDDATLRATLIAAIKSQEGWTATEARDGEDALNQLFHGFRPDVIFVDLRLPKIDGLEVLRRIRQDQSLAKLKVVVASGERDRSQLQAVAQLNVSGYLLKPIQAAKIKAILQQIAAES